MKKIYKILVIILLVIIVITAGIIVYFQLSAKGSAENETKLGPIFETQEFTVNISSSSSRYIKAQFALELSNDKVKEELNQKLIMLQDTVIMVLSKQTLENLSKLEGKDALKDSLVKEINTFLDKGEVTKIYFKNLIFS